MGGEREEIAGKKARLMEKADLIRGNGREASPISTYRLGRIRIGEFVQFEAANILLASREKTGKLFPGAPRETISPCKRRPRSKLLSLGWPIPALGRKLASHHHATIIVLVHATHDDTVAVYRSLFLGQSHFLHHQRRCLPLMGSRGKAFGLLW